jgi:CHRD domain
MKSFAAASAAAVALVVVLVVAGAAGGRTQATQIRVGAPMTAAQEVPAPTGEVSAARGTFTGSIARSGADAVLTWQLTFSGLTGPAGAAHIHIAPRGQSGPVAVPLCGPCTSPASGTATLNAAVLQALQTDGAYANVHTAANAPGEIRGQVAVVASVRTALTPRQEVPRPKGSVNRARALLTATVTKSGTTGTLAWRLTYSRLTGPAAAAHVHIARRGVAGPVVVPLCGPCRSGARGTANLRAPVLTALEAGRAYVNVHTRRNPAGEVRGQVAAVPLTLTGP